MRRGELSVRVKRVPFGERGQSKRLSSTIKYHDEEGTSEVQQATVAAQVCAVVPLCFAAPALQSESACPGGERGFGGARRSPGGTTGKAAEGYLPRLQL